MSDRRIADLQAKLAARTKQDGTPAPGYKKNVEAIRAEIARLSAPQESSPEVPA